ncbi:DUF5819 family protein [Kitasatospora sp. NPDC002040]|uniref:DUF5819 family protein n=1 Tax=Kitasatospora sp. NPDC002040 TaxID=3154661 RepID=UPI0033296F3C
MRTWSTPALVVLCGTGAVLLGGTALFLAALFLHSAPSNALSQRYRTELDAVVYPEFEQNWRLFAPNPLQQNVAVDVRVQTIAADGTVTTGEWGGLTAGDIEAVRGNPAPSHVDQNLLRRAWDFYEATHGEQESTGARPRLAEQYLKRIALQRLGPPAPEKRLFQLQLRSSTSELAPPAWSREQVDTAPKYRELAWWPVDEADLRGLW